jgi:hypothetical protein
VIYEYAPPLGVVPVIRFGDPRYVASSPSGTLLVRGGCDADRHTPGIYCVIEKRRQREVRVQGDVGAERVAALSGGRLAVLVPPRFGASGAVMVVDAQGRATSRQLKWKHVEPAALSILKQGLWLDGLVEASKDALYGWVVGAGPFVGVRVGLDGSVRVGSVIDGIETAFLSGSTGLWLGTGELRETTDSGQTWRQVTMPRELAESVTADSVIASGGERGCSPLGCAFGEWVRTGWGNGAKERLTVAAEPPAVSGEKPFFVNWAMHCVPTGVQSPPVIGVPARVEAADKRRLRGVRVTSSRPSPNGLPVVRNLTSGAWRSFLGVRGPQSGSAELAFDFGTEDHAVQLRGYAWGPRGGRWERTGGGVVRAIDRFTVDHAIWSTEPSRVAWADALEAAQAFGSDPSRRSTTEWSLLLDPGGEGGLLSIRAGGETQLAVVETGTPIATVRGTNQFSLERLSGAVKVGGTWYVGTESNARSFHVLSIEGGQASLLGSFPRYGEGPVPQIVRTARGDALGIWAVGKGRFGAKIDSSDHRRLKRNGSDDGEFQGFLNYF